MHPTYKLELVKGLMKDGSWFATDTAYDDANQLGFAEEDIFDCVVNFLENTHFFKTMPAKVMSNVMQDVYYITYRNVRLYVKLQVRTNAVVVSFKEHE